MIKNTTNGIKIENLTKIFGSKMALNSATMNFDNGKITGLIGFNGSGKTTTFNVLTNFIETYTGDITINGKSPKDITTTKDISYLAAGAEPKNTMKVKRHLAIIADINGLKRQDAKVKIAQLCQAVELDNVMNWSIKKLSKGNQQKIKIVASLLNTHAKYYLLDEPFDGLDPIMVKKVMKLYLELKDALIIITSHRMDVVNDMVSSFYVLKDGVVVDSKTDDNEEVVILVNSEVPMEAIEKMKSVVSVEKKGKITEIKIKDIGDFKAVNKKLIASTKYIFSSLKEKNLTESVFEGYGV